MSELSITPREKAMKARSDFLQHMEANEKQAAIAFALGVSESTVTRIKEKVEDVFYLLYQAGWMAVPADMACVDRKTYEAIAHIATRAMSIESVAHELTKVTGGVE